MDTDLINNKLIIGFAIYAAAAVVIVIIGVLLIKRIKK
jgi:hypothetical protein